MVCDTQIYYPLTHAQKRIWFMENLYPNTSLNIIGGLIRIYGSVNLDLLEEAIQHFIENNEGIRLQLSLEGKEVQQYVQPYARKSLQHFDFSNASDPHIVADAWVQEELLKPFQLYEYSLFDFALVTVRDGEHAYYLKFHHLIADGWSIRLLSEQIANVYSRISAGEPVGVEEKPSYLDYVAKERQYLRSNRFEKDRMFWRKIFTDLPEASLQKKSFSVAGRRKRFYLSREMAERVRNWTEEYKFSLNTFFVSLLFLYLHKSTQQDDLIIGTPVVNRAGVKEKNIFGMFTSTMPIRIKLDPEENLEILTKRVGAELTRSYYHQRYPYDLLVQDLELSKQGSEGLFQLSVNYYNTLMNHEFSVGGLMHDEYYSGYQFYPMQVVIKEWHGELELQFDYKTDEYADGDIEVLYERLCHLIEVVTENGQAPIGSISLLTDSEYSQEIHERNDTEADYPKRPVHQLIEEQAARTPNKKAVSFHDHSLTYAELNAKANRFANHLRRQGVTRNSLVGIHLGHSLEMLVALLGILKAGGAYVPIDPSYPVNRIQHILDDSGVRIVITDRPFASGISYTGQLLDLNASLAKDMTNLELVNVLSDTAYVIYTSGSTGQPKGAVIEHRGLVNYIWWAQATYLPDEDDVIALYSSLSFDLTVTSIFSPLVAGREVVIYAENDGEFILDRILQEKRVTVVKTTPAHLALLKERDSLQDSVRRWIIGGEDLKTEVARKIVENSGGNVTVFNEYGPTETVVGCMIHRYEPTLDTGTSVPIGQPISNTQIYLLDRDGQPVPTGAAGELYISGYGVARGYLNRPELTAERFLSNPFLLGNRIYKTGDLAIRTKSGQITYLGRLDHQVKIRGHRIELGEIENCLLQHRSVSDAVVMDYTDVNGAKHLVAYLVSGKEVVSAFELRQHIMEALPSYMVPTYFVLLEQLPLTANGKIDRVALPDPIETAIIDELSALLDETVEALLVQAVRDVLRIESVTATDNFYQLGGDSVKAIQVVNKLRQANIQILTKEVLAYPVIRELAIIATSSSHAKYPQTPASGTLTPTPIMSWFFSQKFANPHHWNQSVLLKLKRHLTSEQLRQSIKLLIQHHDSLRLYYDEERQALTYLERVPESFLETHDLSALRPVELHDKLREVAQACKASIRLTEGPLLRAALLDLGSQGQRLLLTAHHLVVDSVSWQILLEDLAALLEGNSRLPMKTHSMQHWVEALMTYSETTAREEEEMWIQKEEAEEDFDFSPEMDGGNSLADCERITRTFTAEETEALMVQTHKGFQTQAQDLLVAALVRAIHTHSNRNLVRLELEGHGRDSVIEGLDVARTVGWFTTMFPVAIPVHSSDWGQQLRTVKTELRNIPLKGAGYGALVYMAKRLPVRLQRGVRFNYLGEIDNQLRGLPFTFASEEHGADICPINHATALLDLLAYVKDKRLTVTGTYSRQRYHQTTIESFMDRFADQLREVICFCCRQEGTTFDASSINTILLSDDELDILFD
ncbi:non-ribosomal peptide synthetase [Paenibacillus monticola]|uniref:Amino acid adenylation domain-containing protein n=1 Tax=Paenibacillus monticola TaxID=2666075 RepID=A0A7X2HCJ8_9BACL|nr:non-ribosomal peptide synthetase [Paenibacillus monticola]MRN57063.1 amino acid adenylation domain-containing protein [Paenibacillus monticola]